MTALVAGKAYFGRLAALLGSKPYAIERFRSAEMTACISQHLQSTGTSFDVIFADGLYTLVNLPPTNIPVALNCHNIEWVILERYAALERNPLKRYYAGVEARRMRAAERRACERSAVTMVCSDRDRGLLREICREQRIYVVPNCVDINRYNSCETEPDTKPAPVLLYQGGMDWYPNRDAVEYFVRDMLPAIRDQFPRTIFVVAGRNPSDGFVRKFSHVGGIEFTGTVPEMQPYISKATIIVVPLRIGSGTRLKILEAAAAGKAIVSSNIGAEGLEFKSGKDILLADDQNDFVNAVVRLLRDPQQRAELGRAARETVVNRYSEVMLRKTLGEAISGLREWDDRNCTKVKHSESSALG
jgi:glycosyltransferase involved in cell wall biosynthesis